jgi:hypothetical protein
MRKRGERVIGAVRAEFDDYDVCGPKEVDDDDGETADLRSVCGPSRKGKPDQTQANDGRFDILACSDAILGDKGKDVAVPLLPEIHTCGLCLLSNAASSDAKCSRTTRRSPFSPLQPNYSLPASLNSGPWDTLFLPSATATPTSKYFPQHLPRARRPTPPLSSPPRNDSSLAL